MSLFNKTWEPASEENKEHHELVGEMLNKIMHVYKRMIGKKYAKVDDVEIVKFKDGIIAGKVGDYYFCMSSAGEIVFEHQNMKVTTTSSASTDEDGNSRGDFEKAVGARTIHIRVSLGRGKKFVIDKYEPEFFYDLNISASYGGGRWGYDYTGIGYNALKTYDPSDYGWNTYGNPLMDTMGGKIEEIIKKAKKDLEAKQSR